MAAVVVNKRQAKEVSEIFKSFSHPSRLLMLCRLSDGACSVQELQDACGLEQAPTSQFLARLRKEGRVVGERHGNQVLYSLTDPRMIELLKTLYRLYCDA
ncbi:MAG: winged helix-turn-helix transcriptional regulator [Bdellovibrionales bacterium]|nr:winged helix-turn-helix transcriptional regulator [Bdellovibrionales bacterium]